MFDHIRDWLDKRRILRPPTCDVWSAADGIRWQVGAVNEFGGSVISSPATWHHLSESGIRLAGSVNLRVEPQDEGPAPTAYNIYRDGVFQGIVPATGQRRSWLERRRGWSDRAVEQFVVEWTGGKSALKTMPNCACFSVEA